jgi:hypothetical protein
VLTGWADGSLFHAAELVIAEGQFRATLAGGLVLSATSPQPLIFLQPLERGTAYLSDLSAESFVHRPYLDLAWPYHRDRNVAGGRLRSGGRLHAKGLGMHSGGRIAYRLSGAYHWFESRVAIDDHTAGEGSAVFQVYLAQGGVWKLAWASPTVRGGDAPVSVRLDLTGAEGIALAVEYADRGDQWDRANWLDARLME